MSLLGLSKILGPVSGDAASTADLVETNLGKIKSGTFDPASFFKDATLLGGIKLAQILPGTNNLSGSDVPKMVARDFPDRVEARFEWSGDVTKIDDLKLLIPRADPSKPPTRLTMNGAVITPHDPAVPPSQAATATLTNFKVNLFGFIILWFEEISFDAKNGRKPDVSVRLREGEEAVSFRRAARVRQRDQALHSRQRLFRSARAHRNAERTQRLLFAQPPRGRRGRLRAHQRFAGRRVQPPVRLAAGVGQVQLLDRASIRSASPFRCSAAAASSPSACRRAA